MGPNTLEILKYELVLTKLQLPMALNMADMPNQGEGGHIQRICAVVVAAYALHWQYNQHDRR